jgi:hypothetical protein
MPTADEYRIKAADMNARAKRESNVLTRSEYENLALSYLRLANQAEKNAANDVVYETPPPPQEPHVQQKAQQQQQPQPEENKD